MRSLLYFMLNKVALTLIFLVLCLALIASFSLNFQESSDGSENPFPADKPPIQAKPIVGRSFIPPEQPVDNNPQPKVSTPADAPNSKTEERFLAASDFSYVKQSVIARMEKIGSLLTNDTILSGDTDFYVSAASLGIPVNELSYFGLEEGDKIYAINAMLVEEMDRWVPVGSNLAGVESLRVKIDRAGIQKEIVISSY